MMAQASQYDDAARRELAVEAYIRGLDQGDMAAVGRVLAQAIDDPELDRLLVEVDAELYREANLPTIAEQGQTVRTLLLRHLPSAFIEPETAPPTVGEVAVRLQADHDSGRQLLLAGDVEVNRSLLADQTVLNGPLTARGIDELAIALRVQASARYWERFRRALGSLVMARQAASTYLAAARSRQPRVRARKTPEQGKS
jgi:hypothetical protein